MGHKNFAALCSAVIIAVSASADPRPPQPLFPERELRNVWRFNSAGELDATRTRPLLLYNIHFAESWSGFSLHMAGDQPALLALPAKTSAGYTNLASESGMIRFWFAPDWTGVTDSGDGPGTEAALLQIGAGSEKQGFAAWSLSVDPDGNMISFSAIHAGQPVPLLKTQLQWDAGAWHQVALVWSASETVLFLDG